MSSRMALEHGVWCIFLVFGTILKLLYCASGTIVRNLLGVVAPLAAISERHFIMFNSILFPRFFYYIGVGAQLSQYTQFSSLAMQYGKYV